MSEDHHVNDTILCHVMDSNVTSNDQPVNIPDLVFIISDYFPLHSLVQIKTEDVVQDVGWRVRDSVQHQVQSEQILCARSHHLCPAQTQALQQSAAQQSGEWVKRDVVDFRE